MNIRRRQFVIAAPLVCWPLKPTPDGKAARLRGRIVCLTEELVSEHQVTPACATRGHVYALKTGDGKLHPLLPTESAAAVWLDERYRQLDLQIVARRFPNTEFIEVIKYQTWRNDKPFDLDYFCIVCNISVYQPGPCECCQDPVEYREVPATEN